VTVVSGLENCVVLVKNKGEWLSRENWLGLDCVVVNRNRFCRTLEYIFVRNFWNSRDLYAFWLKFDCEPH